MSSQFSIYLVPLILISMISGGLGVYAWSFRRSPGAQPLSLFFILTAVFTLFQALESMAVQLVEKRLYFNLGEGVQVFIPVVWFLFCLQYATGRRHTRTRYVILLGMLPLLLIVLSNFTGNPLVQSEFELSSPLHLPGFSRAIGPLYWIGEVYGSLLLLAGGLLLSKYMFQGARLFRRQAAILFFASMLPIIGTLLFGTEIIRVELSAFILPIVGLAMMWAVFRYRLLDIVPLGRETVVEGMQEGVIILDLEHRIVDINPAAEKLLLNEASEAVGTPVTQFLALDPGPCQNQERFFLDFPSANGNSAYIEIDRVALVKQAEQVGSVLILRDRTSDKINEEELVKAREDAHMAEMLKTAILANVSHEVRTPLTSIMGFASLLVDEVEIEHQEAMKRILKASQRLLDMMNAVLDLSRLGSGGVELDLETIDLRGLVQSEIPSFRIQARGKGLELELDVPNEPCQVILDIRCMQRVLRNLLNNAIKFTETGKVTVSVAAENDQVIIRIKDTGIGIHESFLVQLFDPFKQESLGLTRSYQGTGLGLSVTQQLVKLLGGSITVESEMGRGSQFEIAFQQYTG